MLSTKHFIAKTIKIIMENLRKGLSEVQSQLARNQHFLRQHVISQMNAREIAEVARVKTNIVTFDVV